MAILPAFDPLVQAVGQMPGQRAGERLESPDVAFQNIERLNGLEYVAVVLGGGLVMVVAADEHLHEREQEFNVLRGRFKAEWIDAIFSSFSADFEIRSVQQVGQLFVAASQVKDEGAGIVLLQGHRDEVHGKGFAAAGAPSNEGVAYVIAGAARAILDALVQVEIERCPVNG